MSRTKSNLSKKPSRQPITPLIGSLLRLPHEAVVARMFDVLNSKGFVITLTELGVFLYPGPDGRRPVDLARQCNMTRQAMNYVLAGLERRGYIERHAGSSAPSREVRLTKKGWEVVVQIRICVEEIEQEWAEYLGSQRFKKMRDTLYDLSRWLGKTV